MLQRLAPYMDGIGRDEVLCAATYLRRILPMTDENWPLIGPMRDT
jgi:hypothetical protein